MKLTSTILTIVVSALLVTNAQAGGIEWKTQLQIKLPAEAKVLAYSADGSRIAVGHSDGRVSIWNVKSGESVQTLNAHSKEINSVQFIKQDTQLLTIGDDNRARLWSTSDWSGAGEIEGVAFAGGVSPDGLLLAAQDPKQAVWVWDLATLKPFKQLSEAGKGGADSVTFTADGKYVASDSIKPLLINVETKQNFSFDNIGDKKTSVKIEQQGNQASISLGSMQEDDAPTHRLIPSRVGSFLALARGWYGQPTFFDLWDTNSSKRLLRFKPKDAGTLMSFSFDNSLLAIEGSEKVTILRISSGKQDSSVKGSGIMQFSPKSMELAVTDGSTLIIYVPKK
jgi:WD40 repeat protein